MAGLWQVVFTWEQDFQDTHQELCFTTFLHDRKKTPPKVLSDSLTKGHQETGASSSLFLGSRKRPPFTSSAGLGVYTATRWEWVLFFQCWAQVWNSGSDLMTSPFTCRSSHQPLGCQFKFRPVSHCTCNIWFAVKLGTSLWLVTFTKNSLCITVVFKHAIQSKGLRSLLYLASVFETASH